MQTGKNKIRLYTCTELKQCIGSVLNAATRHPVYITKHQVPYYVLMNIDMYVSSLNGENTMVANDHHYCSFHCKDIARTIIAEASKLMDFEREQEERAIDALKIVS
jgi:hypothetical protein